MIQINLLPDIKQEFVRAKRLRDTVISISVLVGFGSIGLVVIMLVLLGVQMGREAIVDGNIQTEYAKLQEVEDLNELVTLREQLNNIGDQHANKTVTSRLFRVLEAVNPVDSKSNVQFSSIQLAPGDNTLSVEGSTANGYRAVEAMAKTAMSAKLVYESGDGDLVTEALSSAVEVSETSLREDAGAAIVSFRVTITVNPMLFSNQLLLRTIVSTDKEIDVTDSRIGIPESMFTPKDEDIDGEG